MAAIGILLIIFAIFIIPILVILAFISPRLLNIKTVKRPEGKYNRKEFLTGLCGLFIISVIVGGLMMPSGDRAKTTKDTSAPVATTPVPVSVPKVTAQAYVEPPVRPEVKITGSKEYLQDYHLDSKKIKNPADIEKVVSSIPNLKQGLADNGLQVKWIEYGHYTEFDIKASEGMTKKQDVAYNFYTNDPKEGLPCEIWNHFNIDKRGKTWMPQTRTANYLMTGECSAPKQ